MEEKLAKAFEIANYMSTLAHQKRVLQETFQQNTIYFYNGYQFNVTKELINFVKTLIDLGQTESILIDDNNLPVDVQNLSEFLTNILDKYTTAINEYYTNYQELKSKRSVESLVDV